MLIIEKLFGNIKMNICLIVTAIITAVSSSIIINEHSRNAESDSLVECLEKLNIPETSLGNLIIHSNTTLMENLIQVLRPPHVMLNMRNDITEVKEMIWKYSYNIVVVDNSSDFQMLLDKLHYTPSLDLKGKFLVLLMRPEDPSTFMQIAWKRNVLNMCVIQYDPVENITKVYSYFPYAKGNCGNFDAAVLLGKCEEVNLNRMYTNKVPKVFNGCTVRANVALLEPAVLNVNATEEDAKQAGYEALLVKIILQRMNLTQMKLLNTVAYGYKYKNGTYSVGTYSDLMNDIADFGYSRMFVNFSVYWDFDMTQVYFYERYAWHVPKAGPGEQWKNLILIFEALLWFLLIAMLVINIVVWWMLAKLSGIDLGLSECALYSWYSLLTGSVSLVQLKTSRFLAISWTVFALLIATAYQSQFLSILLKPIYEVQIASDEQILGSRLKIILLSEPCALLKAGLPFNEAIFRRARVVSFYALHEMRMTYPSDMATVASEIRSKYLASKYMISAGGEVKVYIFQETFYNNPIVMFFQRGHPFTERFNEIILRILSSGMFQKWVKDINHTYKPAENAESSAITMDHLIGAFFALLIGLSTATVVFIWEIVIFKVHSRRNNPEIATLYQSL